jgi:DNA-3-methyladenine glycosylase
VSATGQFTAERLSQAKRLPREFFNRDAVTVARELLGKLLIRREGRKLLAGRLVEDEAYLGQDDPAAHAYGGRTARNFVLFGPPWPSDLNVSCMSDGHGEGVLFRAMEPVFGLEAMARARGLELPASPRVAELRMISTGPGRMSQALGITRERDNNKDLASRASDLWLADDGFRPERIVATPRIGITKAVEQPLRFAIAGNAYISGKKIR